MANCSELFKPVFTDYGVCCTFNLLTDLRSWRKTDINYNESEEEPSHHNGEWSDWTLLNGYRKRTTPPTQRDLQRNGGRPLEEPHRTTLAGLSGGLTFTLDLQVSHDTVLFL